MCEAPERGVTERERVCMQVKHKMAAHYKLFMRSQCSLYIY